MTEIQIAARQALALLTDKANPMPAEICLDYLQDAGAADRAEAIAALFRAAADHLDALWGERPGPDSRVESPVADIFYDASEASRRCCETLRTGELPLRHLRTLDVQIALWKQRDSRSAVWNVIWRSVQDWRAELLRVGIKLNDMLETN